MIYEFEFRKLTAKEKEAILINAKLFDELLARCPLKCGNPSCQYPLPAMDNFRLPIYGEVCELCYRMFHALSERTYWIDVHRAWKKLNPDKDGNTEIY